MLTLLFWVVAFAQGVALAFGVRLYLRSRNWYALLTVLTMLGLVYDNVVIAAGTTIGEGDLLKNLNAGRFIIHAVLTPLMIIFGFGVARRAGVAWAQSRRNHAVFCTLATAMLLLGAYSDILMLNLEPRLEDGILRYVNVGGIKGPPIPAIVTIIVLIVVGVFVWRRGKSWWMAAGSVLMFIAAMAGVRLLGVGNLGEVAMSSALVDGERVAQGSG